MAAYSGPYPVLFSGTASQMLVNKTTFSGGITNTGTIGPGGIDVNSSTLLSGGILDIGVVAGGIDVDSSSKITAPSGAAIAVENTVTFGGGISNAGALSAGGDGIFVGGTGVSPVPISNFSGGIINRGSITAGSNGIGVNLVTNFSGGVTNSGAISSANKDGIELKSAANGAGGTFSGNIVNKGAISTHKTGIYVGMVGSSLFAGSISNSGAITSTDGEGIYLSSIAQGGGTFAGNIVNTASISAYNTAIDVEYVGFSAFTGGITNSGKITATNGHGIYIYSFANGGGGTFAGGITNNGAITAGAGNGIEISVVAYTGSGTFAGGIVNSAAIAAYNTGIDIHRVGKSLFSGGISNSGNIVSTIGDGISITAVAYGTGGTFGGSITNKGVISSYSTGIYIARVGSSLFSGSISNSGAIACATGFGIGINHVADSGTFAGSIVNSAAISAGASGLYIDTVGSSRFSGSISNSGAITSTNAIGIEIGNVAVSGTFAGSIVNRAALSAYSTGFYINSVGASTFSGSISNSGAIKSANGYGIDIGNVGYSGTFAGSIVNSAGIAASKTGINIFVVGSSLFSGGISNSGNIVSASKQGIVISTVAFGTGGTFGGSIINKGVISAYSTGLHINKVGSSTFSGSISNSGAIRSRESDGIYIQHVADSGTFAGSIANNAALAADSTAIAIDLVGSSAFIGGITNSGAITAAGAKGIRISQVAFGTGGTFGGGIINKGVISADTDGIYVKDVGKALFSGSISNSGAITSERNHGIKISQVAFGTSGTFGGSIINKGAISALVNGISIIRIGSSRFSGGISNSGSIVSASNQGIVISTVAYGTGGSFGGSIINNGVISAYSTGLDINKVGSSTFSGSISNSGAIRSRGSDGIDIVSVADSGTFAGSIANSASVSANVYGIDIKLVGSSAFNGGITNSGAIMSVAGAGIEISHVANGTGGTFGGSINNKGVISADTNGIIVNFVGSALFSGSISNSGAITSARGFGIHISSDAYGTGGAFGKSIINSGAISAYITGIYVNRVGSSRFSGGISNSGAITSEDRAGIIIASVAYGAGGTFAGSIINSAAISAHSTGIYVNNVGSALFSGGISNSGAIKSADNRGIRIEGVADSGTFASSIVNSAAISAHSAGIFVSRVGSSRFSGGINNSGNIVSADQQGIVISSVADETGGTFGGSIINKGAISAHFTGISIAKVGASLFSGNISNSGAITAAAGVGDGIQIRNVADSGTFNGNIVNSAAVSAHNKGININNDGSVLFSGSIINSAAIASRNTGIYVSLVGASAFSGNISNSGAITASTAKGIAVTSVADADGGAFKGNIVNKGKISARKTGIDVLLVGASTFSGNISNSGAITASTAKGIAVTSVANASGGIFKGNIVNKGTISSRETGINIDNVGSATLSGGITNSAAVISTVNDGFKVDSVAAAGTFIGNIVNSSTITASLNIGLYVGNILSLNGAISNSGTGKISALDGIAVNTSVSLVIRARAANLSIAARVPRKIPASEFSMFPRCSAPSATGARSRRGP